MKIKLLIPAMLLATGVLSSCGAQEPTFTINNPHSGLGFVDVYNIEGNTYELIVVPVYGVEVSEVKVNDKAVTLTNDTYEFTAKGGENTISVAYTEPTEITLGLALDILNFNGGMKERLSYDYTYRNLFLDSYSLEEYANIYKKYEGEFYTNGMKADVAIGSGVGTMFSSEEGFEAEIETTGELFSYKVDEENYMRAMVPETLHEDGFAQLLERNYYFDETSEDLGYVDTLISVYLNLMGAYMEYPENYSYDYPASYGYTHSDTKTETEDSITFSLISACEMVDYGDYVMPEEQHSHNVTIDKETYEVTDVSILGKIYQTTSDSPVVTVLETAYSNVVTGYKTAGEIPVLGDTSTIDPSYVTISKPSIQEDIADGELSKEDAVRILDNIWAYSENTQQTTATGEAYMYDADYNEIPGVSDLTITAYKDYFLVTENIFTPDDQETYGQSISSVYQKSARPEGVANVAIVNGVVSDMDSYLDYVGPEYNMSQNFSASPLKQDWTIGMVVNEAISYGLTTFVETSEWGSYGMVYDNYSATKQGNNITLKWSVATTYDTVENADPATYYQIVIEDNFVTEIAYGASFEDCLTYHMTQGEYTEFTGTVYEWQPTIY